MRRCAIAIACVLAACDPPLDGGADGGSDRGDARTPRDARAARDAPPVPRDVPETPLPEGSSLFVGVGNWGLRGMTRDGAAWSYCGNPPTGSDHSPDLLRAVGYGDGVFVAVGGDQNSMVMRSLDGVHWEEDLHPTTSCEGEPYPGSCDNWMGAVAYGDGTWIAGGGNGALMRSTDGGETWEGIHPDPTPSAIRTFAFGEGRFIAGTDSGALIVTRDGGNSFESHPLWEHAMRVAYGRGAFVAWGANWNGSGFDRACFVSTNAGDDWTACASEVAQAGHFAHDGDRWHARTDAGYATSDDAITWTPQAAGEVPSEFRWDGERWVGFGGGRGWSGASFEDWASSAEDVPDFRGFTVGFVLEENLPVEGVPACEDDR
jgi:hypothetical protein